MCAAGCGKAARRNAAKYCSLQCHFSHRYQIRVALLIGGDYPATNTTGSGRFVQKFLRQHYGDRCSRCGWNEVHPVTGRVPLEVEHMDGNWQNTRLENLALLCPNCHSLTPTFRALNKGKGRALRLGGRANPLKEASKDC